MDDSLPWIALRNVPDLRRLQAHALLERYGSPLAIFSRAAWELHELCSKRAALALSRGPDLEAARDELERARAAGLRAVLVDHAGKMRAGEVPPGEVPVVRSLDELTRYVLSQA